MPMLRISCDSACDLTAEMRQQYDIAVPALGITLGDELRYDGVHRHDGSYSYGINEAALLESSYPEENLELLVRRFCSYNHVHAYDGSINFNVREESYAF